MDHRKEDYAEEEESWNPLWGDLVGQLLMAAFIAVTITAPLWNRWGWSN